MKKWVTILVTIGLSFTLLGCITQGSSHSVYRAVLQSLPSKIDPRENQTNIYHYINLHLFYPLFQTKEEGGLESKFLDMHETKALGRDFTQFQFCLRRELKFSDGSAIQVSDLEQTLLDVHKMKMSLVRASKIEIWGDCVEVKLEKTDPFYFDKLADIQSTILKRAKSKDEDAVGFGPYRLNQKSFDRIELAANGKEVAGSFKQIEFIRAPQALEKLGGGIDDWNHLYHIPIPSELRKDYQEIKRQVYKTYSLLVRIRNRKRRIEFSRCLDREGFVHALRMNLSPLPGIIPHGMPGASVDFSKIIDEGAAACKTSHAKKYEVQYFNYNSYQKDFAEAFFNHEGNSLPIRVQVKEQSLEETIAAAEGSKELITLMGSDAMNSRVEEFFNGFVRPHSFLMEPLAGVERNLSRASENVDKIAIGEFVEAAHRELLKSGYVIPLGQLVTSQFYPRDIKNIRFVDRVHGFPSIQLMEVE